MAGRDEDKQDAATKRQTADMSEAVQALLAKYKPANADAAESGRDAAAGATDATA